ncbi:MAG TPA: putative Ig domain-containing protein [Mucilaginibacter sp.]|jgi:alpha-galactosidase|nr:putative Ig domain-containing protein [Mucilaginibacter sp.]
MLTSRPVKPIILMLSMIFAHAICSAQQKPQINNPELFGVRTGKHFFYTIPVSGSRPVEIDVKNLPEGVSYDKNQGIISGKILKNGRYQIEIVVKNKKGTASKHFTIVAGDKLALTPPMGWSSWYSYGRKAKESDILKTAQLMKHYGLDQYGWSILEIDDPWTNQPDEKDSLWERLSHKVNNDVYQYHEGPNNLPGRKGKLRDQNGKLLPNQYFKNIEQTVKQVHDLGFKVGIYSSPGPLTCGGVSGSYGHELQDAQYFAHVGFDYLKYDWCSYGVFAKDNSVEELMKPYTLMGNALKNQPRDIIFALCQYGMGDVWKWGYKTEGQLWRTGDDVRDNWASVYAAFKKLADKSEYVQPGRWNDPDILQIGAVGAESREGNSNHLTHEEQHTVMTMWCLLSAPLFIGANLEHIDPFTLSLITNNEVISVDQDALGKAANLKLTLGNKVEVWTKKLYDGRIAVGLLNPTDTEQSFGFPFSSIGENGSYLVRNLWQKKNLGTHLKTMACKIPSHGILLITLKK